MESANATAVTTSAATVNGSILSFDGADQPTVTLYYDTNGDFSQNRVDPFIPLSFGSNLGFWLDASDTASLTASSGAVAQWNDKSGNGLHVTQGTADKQPTTGSATQNSLNVLSFDGADFLQRSSSNVENNDQTWFLVAQVDSGGID